MPPCRCRSLCFLEDHAIRIITTETCRVSSPVITEVGVPRRKEALQYNHTCRRAARVQGFEPFSYTERHGMKLRTGPYIAHDISASFVVCHVCTHAALPVSLII